MTTKKKARGVHTTITKTKPTNSRYGWAAFGPDGHLDIKTVRYTRSEAIQACGCDSPQKWDYLYKKGYRIQKVLIANLDWQYNLRDHKMREV